MVDTLMTIGDFSSRSRISVRMLRHYDEHRLLVPATVDPATGYRYYAHEQLPDATHIRRLRDVGFTVSAISAVLAVRGTPDYARALKLQREVVAEEQRAARLRLALIDQLLDQEGHTMNAITVSKVSVPARTIVMLRGVIPSYADEGQLWQRFMPELARQGIRPVGPGGAIEHQNEFVEQNPEMSVFLPVEPGTVVTAPLEVHELPDVEVAQARVEGPYSLISEAHARIQEFIAAEGLAVAGAAEGGGLAARVYNRYLNAPDDVSEESLLTEVNVPLA